MNRKYLFGAVVVSTALLFTGFGCKQKSPEQVVKEMPVAMADIESADFWATFSGNPSIFDEEANSSLQQIAPGIDGIEVSLSGQFNRDDQLLGDSQGTFSIAALGEKGFKVAGDYVGTESTNFFQLTEVMGLAELGIPFDLSALLNKWVESPNDPEAMMMLEDAMEEDDEDELTEDQVEEIEELFMEATLFSEVADLGNEDIKGNATTKFKVVLDKEGILDFVTKASEVAEDEMNEEDRVDLGQLIDRINSGDTFMWIGTKDNRLYQFEANPTELKGANVSQTAKLVFTFSNFNNPTEVSIPTDAVPFEEVMAEVMGGSMFGDLFSEGLDQVPRTGDMEFNDPEAFLKNLQGGDAIDPADLEEAFKALENL